MALMDALAGWLRQIIAVVLLASLVDLLLPNRTMQRYVRLVAGLFILLTVAGPILQWMKGDFSSRLAADMQSVEKVPEGAADQMAIIEKEGEKLRNRQEMQAADLVSAKLASAIQNEVELSENRKVRKVDVETTRTAEGSWTVDRVTVVLEAEQEHSKPSGDPSPIGEIESIAEVNIDVTVETWPKDAPQQTKGTAQNPEETAVDRPTQLRVSALIAGKFGIAADHVEVQQALSS